ncbi:MAG: DUF4162 domain-containing protein [Bacteroidales bacterium]|nr:DUF4162 domain-containing protein [Bacteroidales bacterium]
MIPAEFELLHEQTEDGINKATIRLPKGTSQNQLLTLLIPHVTLHSFNEIIPSMNDILSKP